MNLINEEKALELLRASELLVVSTDTVYGIACDYANPLAVNRVFQIKGRSEKKPLVVLISSLKMLNEVAEEVTEKHRLLMERFWPGALTLIFKKSAKVADLVVAGSQKVGVRMPANKVTLSLIEKFGRPIVATSVNKSGRESLLDLSEILAQFPELAVLDGGKPELGVESTVLDLTGEKPKILRVGAISKEQIEKVLGVEISV